MNRLLILGGEYLEENTRGLENGEKHFPSGMSEGDVEKGFSSTIFVSCEGDESP